MGGCILIFGVFMANQYFFCFARFATAKTSPVCSRPGTTKVPGMCRSKESDASAPRPCRTPLVACSVLCHDAAQMARNSPRGGLDLDLHKAKLTKENLREAKILF